MFFYFIVSRPHLYWLEGVHYELWAWKYVYIMEFLLFSWACRSKYTKTKYMQYFFVKMNLKLYPEIVDDCGARHKGIPQYRNYQLPDHLHISPRIISIKAHHASVKHLRLSVVLSHYDNDNVKWSHYEFSIVLMCIPKVKIVKNLSLFLHLRCTDQGPWQGYTA